MPPTADSSIHDLSTRLQSKYSAPSRSQSASLVGGDRMGFPAHSRRSICDPEEPGDSLMHGPDGTNYPNANVFKTVEPPNRVEVEHISEDHHFVLSITFACQGSQTLVGWEQTFDTVEHKQLVAPWVEPANEQNLNRLQRELEGANKSGAA